LREILKVAVTGGSGCLGQPLIRKLANNDIDINLLSLPGETPNQILQKNMRIVIGGLDSYESLCQLTKERDIVFHLAGKVHSVPRTKEEEQKFYKVNVEGTKNLIDAATKNNVKRIIFYSTVGVYGKDADFCGNELSPCHPNTIYSKSKYLAEQLILESSKDGGPDGVVLRFPVVYGPLDRGNVAGLIKAVYGKYFFYFGDGTAKRSMISSENAAEAAYSAAFKSGAADQIFCVTDGQDYTVADLVENICLILNADWRPFHLPLSMAYCIGKVGDFLEKRTCSHFPLNSDKVRKLSRPLTFSCEKAKEILDYRPTETLLQGLSGEIDWLKTINGWT
jgi:GlcNAc-P-P-Und epimerase